MAAANLKLVSHVWEVRPHPVVRLQEVLSILSGTNSLEAGEHALDQVSDILGLPYPAWISDIASPYYSFHLDSFARSRRWPAALMELWWGRNAALKMPIYIRCRFEHLPFISCLQRRRANTRAPYDEQRIADILKEMGASVMLTVPVHLPKSQIGMIGWAGGRRFQELRQMLPDISGYLLGIGHHMMRIARQDILDLRTNLDERTQLTPREWDCMRTLAQGYREAEIAELNGISKVTVRFHLDNVVQKFGCKTRTQAVALASQLGMLGPIGA